MGFVSFFENERRCRIFGDLRRRILMRVGFLPPLQTSAMLAVGWVGQLSAAGGAEQRHGTGADPSNCSDSISRRNSPSQIQGIVFGQSSVSH